MLPLSNKNNAPDALVGSIPSLPEPNPVSKKQGRSYSEAAKTQPHPFLSPYFNLLKTAITILSPQIFNQIFKTSHTHEHPPFVKDWERIWTTPPILIDPSKLDGPILETEFFMNIFQLQLQPDDVLDPCHHFSQGTTIIFKGFDIPDIRYIVEWLRWIDNHQAYLQVVGINSRGEAFSYDDPNFPSFILKVPVCVTNVPYLPSAIRSEKESAWDNLYLDCNGNPLHCKICY